MTGPHGQTSLITVAACTLNQWALDFNGNVERILKSCDMARSKGATYRLGPELELCGYGCEDHFFEPDTFAHCWESLAELFQRGATDDGLLCDFGMPVLYHGIRYNCRIVCVNRTIVVIRPKLALADSGNYRESRYFTAYQQPPAIAAEEQVLVLPTFFQQAFGQRTAPFGVRHIQSKDAVKIGCESCEELWTPHAPHIDLALQGVEIIGNGSGSHHELRKLNQRLELVIGATRKCGGVYLYSNQRGCDGGRSYYDGGAIIVANGQVLAQAQQFSIHDVEVITATIDLDDVRSYRASIPSFGIQAATAAAAAASTPRSLVLDCPDCTLLDPPKSLATPLSSTTSSSSSLLKEATATASTSGGIRLHLPEEECCLGPACWLWDYLRRSGASGFLLPLSGGADSSSVATIVGAMCHLVYEACIEDPKGPVADDVRRICRTDQPLSRNINNDEPEYLDDSSMYWIPSSPQEVANSIFHTVFMGTEHSSSNTTSRAKRLGDAIGSYHLNVPIDQMVAAVLTVFTMTTTGNRTPRFQAHGGTMTEDLALQNVQARLRMVTAYLYAQLLPWVRGQSGFLLVLGSANVDEGLRGYMTKYDCSSADLNPIGAISKGDLKRMLLWASERYEWPVLAEIAGAPPTAELRPLLNPSTPTTTTDESIPSATAAGTTEGGDEKDLSAEHSQLDEEEMGMTYAELGAFGTLRKIARCGPVSMFRKLCVTWNHLIPAEVATKVKRFFYFYSVNRHKMCTLTPAYHAEAYSPDDNRFDLRQFLYNTKWPRQFAVIDQLVLQDQELQEKERDATVTKNLKF
jgi:NAD+ synthase (glutamine-hydrolysing)